MCSTLYLIGFVSIIKAEITSLTNCQNEQKLEKDKGEWSS